MEGFGTWVSIRPLQFGGFLDAGLGGLQDVNLNIIKLGSNYMSTREMLGVTRVRSFIHLGLYHSWNPILRPLDLNNAWEEIPRDHNLGVEEFRVLESLLCSLYGI